MKAVVSVSVVVLLLFSLLAVGAPRTAAVSRAYVVNQGDGNTSVVAVGDMLPSPPVSAGGDLFAIAAAPDGRAVYSLDSETGRVYVIDTATDTVAGEFHVSGGARDIAIAADSSRAYVAREFDAAIDVVDTQSREIVDTWTVPALTESAPQPTLVDVTPGGRVFTWSRGDQRVIALDGPTGAVAGTIEGVTGATELKISADGTRGIVVGADGPIVFDPVAIAPLPVLGLEDIGAHVDVAIAGTRAYLLNEAFVGLPTKAPDPGEPSIDVVDLTTGVYAESIGLGAGDRVRGIAVAPDGSSAYVTRAPSEGLGGLLEVDLTTGTLGRVAALGDHPRRVVLVASATVPGAVSYLLPRTVKLKLRGAGRDGLVTSGFYDDGGLEADLSRPVTIDVGGFSHTFTLTPNRQGTVFSIVDDVLTLRVKPDRRGSSRGSFRARVRRATLEGLVPSDGPLELRMRVAELPPFRSVVLMSRGGYRLGHARGALVDPTFFPSRATARLRADGLDGFSFGGRFATGGATPDTLGTVRFAFGPDYAIELPGDAFERRGDVFHARRVDGRLRVAVKIDFLRETVMVSAKGVELGALDAETIEFCFDAGAGAGLSRRTVRLGGSGARRQY